MLRTLLHKWKSMIQQQGCLVCRRILPHEDFLCLECAQQLGLRKEGYPLERSGPCQYHAATLFNRRLKRLLYECKFSHKTRYLPILSALLQTYWQQSVEPVMNITPENTYVVPIPDRQGRVNHVYTMAEEFARKFNFVYLENGLEWVRQTLPQHALTGRLQRFDNVRRSFTVTADAMRQITPSTFSTVIVIDDLTTTGATLKEACQAFGRCHIIEGPIVGLALSHIPLAFYRNQLVFRHHDEEIVETSELTPSAYV